MHRDAARPPTAADHANREEGDPSPCAEDEEFFEARPDAEDMEEAMEQPFAILTQLCLAKRVPGGCWA